jgi:hypothetical protein
MAAILALYGIAREFIKTFTYRHLQWLRAIVGKPDKNSLEKYSKFERNMWSTAAFFHSAGITVTDTGEVVHRDQCEEGKAVFAFKPIKIMVDEQKGIEWSLTDGPTNRYIFWKKEQVYGLAMTKALKQILMVLP